MPSHDFLAGQQLAVAVERLLSEIREEMKDLEESLLSLSLMASGTLVGMEAGAQARELEYGKAMNKLRDATNWLKEEMAALDWDLEPKDRPAATVIRISRGEK